MPGGRLSRQDRERIAVALREGYGYAEIARELARPTSTVTREVARNGGAAYYRADDAHRATTRRARRPRQPAAARPAGASGPAAPTVAGPSVAPATTGVRPDAEAVRAFREEFAVLMAQTGLSRMAARVLACLFVTDSGALTPSELTEQLGVSPASVSKAIGYLEELDLVRREQVGRRRRQRYVVDDDVWMRAWRASSRVNGTWADAADRGAGLLGPSTPAGSRLAEMGRFFARLGEDMAGGPSAAALDDALTVLAALLHAGTPLPVARVAGVLGWPAQRVSDALRDAELRPDVTDPVVVRRAGSDLAEAVAAPRRLTAAQRSALHRTA